VLIKVSFDSDLIVNLANLFDVTNSTWRLLMSGEDTLYQVLLVEHEHDKEKIDSQGIDHKNLKTKLLTKPKQELEKQFGTVEGFQLPSNGAELDDNFMPIVGWNVNTGQDKKNNLAKRYGARNLLQYRKLSQLVAKSWLDDDDDKDPNLKHCEIIRKLIITANLQPEEFETVTPSDNEQKKEQKSGQQGLDKLYDLITSGSGKNGEQNTNRYRDTIILPDALNWRYMRLSLLCAGQAIYWDKNNDQYELINEPILSTYDMCVNYAFTTVSWSQYIATSSELVQAGINQIPPYYKVVFPYPPRPNVDSKCAVIRETDIIEWATAKEESGKLPFYPPKNGSKYESDLVRNVIPTLPLYSRN